MSLERLSFILGTWRGSGTGIYPTIEGFTYTEEVEFSSIPGKPFVVYRQKTTGSDGLPLHSESGYLRSPAEGAVELVIAQPTGIVEVHNGTIDGTSLTLRTISVTGTPTAVEVSSVARHLRVDGDTLTYELDMAAVGQPEQRHLTAKLERVGSNE